MSNDATAYILAAAAFAVVAWGYPKLAEYKSQVDSCKSEFQGFKEGVIYRAR